MVSYRRNDRKGYSWGTKKNSLWTVSSTNKTPEIQESYLVYINISIDCLIISWYLTNSDLIESTVVHIFYDDIVISIVYDDTHMSIISIVSTPRELYDSTNSRFYTCFCTSSSSIFEPLFCISPPIHRLILCDIPSTVSWSKSSTQSSIFDSISVFCWVYSHTWSRTWSFSWNWDELCWILCFWRTFFDSTRNNKFFSYF